MEVEGVQPCKRSRVSNGASKIAHKEQQQHQDDDEADGEAMGGGAAQLRSWPHHHQHASSRIFRVSRASGGKDRHSKVLTAKGLRDRRVRLSVSTAIQFYDLQDRLGFDQPSKAVEWLINAASAAIAKLPALDGPFPEPPPEPHSGKNKQVEEPMPEADADADPDPDAEPSYNQQHLSLTRSGCSSTSDTSKGSVLSLSRSESRTKARERARERAARDKEKERADNVHVDAHHHALNPSLNSTSSFTELLTGSGGGGGNGTAAQDTSSANCIQKQHRHVPPATATADYFGQAGLFAQAHTQKQHQLPPFCSQPHFVNSSPMAMLPFGISAGAADHPEMQQISFMQDSLIPVTAVAPPADYNLNFSISSSGLAGLNRGTLQSNSPSQLPHHHQLQRLSSQVDGSNLPFFFGAAAATSAENQFPAGFDARLQLYYGDFKGKGKS